MTRTVCFASLALALGCGSPVGPAIDFRAGGGTGLEGQVLHGPIMPVCRVDVPCDAPFSGWFAVSRNDSVVARFRSDSSGHFRVALAPGTYAVMQADSSDYFIIFRGQRQDVTVGRSGYTKVTLFFDTGIR